MERAQPEHRWGYGRYAAGRTRVVRPVVAALLALALALGVAATLDLAHADAPSAEAATVYGRVTNGGGRCLENLNNGTAVNNKIQINVCGTAAAQQWSRQPDETLRTPAGRCIAPYLNRTAENTPVVLVACSTATTLRWVPYNGYLINRGTNKCLTYSGSNANGSWAATATCRAVAAHRWTVPAASTVDPTTTTPKPTTTTPKPTTTTTVPPTTTTTTTVPPTTTTTTTVPPTTTTTTTVPPTTTTTTTVPPTTTTTTVPPTTTTTTTVPPTTTTTTTVPPTTTTTSEVPPTTTTTSEVPPTTTTTVAPPTTTTTTAPAAVPPPFRQTGTTVWRADLSQPDVVQAGFINRSSNRQLCDGAYNNPNLPWPIKTQAAPGGRAGNAVPYTLPNCAIRLETEPNHRVFAEGDDYYFGFSFYLADDFPLDTTSWQVIEQLHGAPGTGSPPVSFQAAKGGLLIDGGANKPGATTPGQYAYQKRLMNLERGRWYNVVYRVVFSADPAKSWVSVWVDGQNVLENFQPPCATVYPPTTANDRPGTYRKQGLYHFKDIPGGTIWQAGHKLGTGYDAADPSR